MEKRIEDFKIDGVRSIEQISREQMSTFRRFTWFFMVAIVLVVIISGYLAFTNKNSVVAFDGTYALKKVETVEDKVFYFTSSFTKLLFDGNKYTFDTTVTYAFYLTEPQTQGRLFIQSLVDKHFYEALSTENATLITHIDSVKMISTNPIVADVYFNKFTINQFGQVQKRSVIEYTLGSAEYNARFNPIGYKVHNIKLVSEEEVVPEKH